MRTTVLVAPAGRGVGITTACLGIVRALDREGIRVGFAKPVANREPDHTIPLLSLGAHFAIPPAVPRGEAEGLLAAGDDQTLMERVVAIADKAGEDVDVLIVAGDAPGDGDGPLLARERPDAQGARRRSRPRRRAVRPDGRRGRRDDRDRRARLRRALRRPRRRRHPEPGLRAEGGSRRARQPTPSGPAPPGARVAPSPGSRRSARRSIARRSRPRGSARSRSSRATPSSMAPRVKDIGDALHAQVLFPGEARTRARARTSRSAR